jgi:hypothetical protein
MLFSLAERSSDLTGRQDMRFRWAEICDLADCQDMLFSLDERTYFLLAARVCDSHGLRRSVVLLTGTIFSSLWLEDLWSYWLPKICDIHCRNDLWSCWLPRYDVPIGWEDLLSYWLPKICDSHCWKDLWSCWLPRYDVPLAGRTFDRSGHQGMRFPWTQIY